MAHSKVDSKAKAESELEPKAESKSYLKPLFRLHLRSYTAERHLTPSNSAEPIAAHDQQNHRECFLILSKLSQPVPRIFIMIHVVAIITTKPGMRNEVLLEFNKIVDTVLQEEGCIEYGPTIDAVDAPSMQTTLGENTFVVIEKWSSVQALEAHGSSAHMLAYADKVKHPLADRVIHVLTPSVE